ncbi:hypothetical protein L596_009216 [Steinernema carpocapsae]|uniref:Uncharacterized protein n=1 Tax=Steinernema carpocapsae TaxID=34508 RepID=A0A4U5PFI1_STECR|nr:hypothetical protein L596_009216 [Steinernema carpocapsae]
MERLGHEDRKLRALKRISRRLLMPEDPEFSKHEERGLEVRVRIYEAGFGLGNARNGRRRCTFRVMEDCLKRNNFSGIV